ncbi:alpha/beta hydrolase fold domain-containing protein [Kineococcus rubinsiae]|uniref:alpha/beta hydrolase fold domain-containing protein n=1 Tax=Kineococcus rubinsiae TaxID=2609562 RepID=UPI00142FDEA7|nr:alpha/beta hydrolase fold domain-containing protein [Kineococcus rubinsiae]NIZ92815.1 alpha/beta hydrolase [Kineococcus rubinsiae]
MPPGLDHPEDPRLLPLVAESRAFYAQRGARRGPGTLTELAAVRAAAGTPDPAPVEVLELEGHRVPVRVHAPSRGRPRAVVLDVHGGGFLLGSTAGDDRRHRRLADALGVVVVGVEHRLAPEHPWPAAADDCEVVARWLLRQAGERFGTTALALAGLSSGATLALTTLLRLRDRGLSAVRGAVLHCGTYDLSGRTPAGRLIAGEFFLDAYAGPAADRTHPDLSPGFAEFAGLPPVLLVVGADDVLLEDNRAVAGRLVAAGVDVDLAVYPASPHAFTQHPTPMARAALDDADAWLARRLGPAAAGPPS